MTSISRPSPLVPNVIGRHLKPHQTKALERTILLAGRAALRKRVTMSYDGVPASGKYQSRSIDADLTDLAIDARKQFNQLLSVMPVACAGVVFDICVFEKGLQEIEGERQWPRRSAKLVLQIALDILAGEFGYGEVATGRGSGAPHNWMDLGGRPLQPG